MAGDSVISVTNHYTVVTEKSNYLPHWTQLINEAITVILMRRNHIARKYYNVLIKHVNKMNLSASY